MEIFSSTGKYTIVLDDSELSIDVFADSLVDAKERWLLMLSEKYDEVLERAVYEFSHRHDFDD